MARVLTRGLSHSSLTDVPVIGSAHTNLFDFADDGDGCGDDLAAPLTRTWPRLNLDTMCQRCDACGKAVSSGDVRLGWNGNDTDYTTRCTSCGARFVPRFRVSCDAGGLGSPGLPSPGAVLVEFLSGPTLLKEAARVQRAGWTAGQLSESSAAVFWNMLLYMVSYGLPLRPLRVLSNARGREVKPGEG